MKKIFSLIYGNCTGGAETMLKLEDNFEDRSAIFDSIWLFKIVKKIVYGMDTKSNFRVSLHTAIMSFMLLQQYNTESSDTYSARFKSSMETLKIAGGSIF